MHVVYDQRGNMQAETACAICGEICGCVTPHSQCSDWIEWRAIVLDDDSGPNLGSEEDSNYGSCGVQEVRVSEDIQYDFLGRQEQIVPRPGRVTREWDEIKDGFSQVPDSPQVIDVAAKPQLANGYR